MQKNTDTEKKVNPWEVYNKWMFDRDLNTPIPEEVLRSINVISVLESLINQFELTIFLNNEFNDYYTISSLNKEHFFIFIKKTMIRYNIDRYSLMFMKRFKDTPISKKLSRFYPNLNRDEINMLMNYAKDDEDYEELLYHCDIKKRKASKKKVNKKLLNEHKEFFGIEDKKKKPSKSKKQKENTKKVRLIDLI
jgi:hypothetical protein